MVAIIELIRRKATQTTHVLGGERHLLLQRIDSGEFACITCFATRDAQYSGHPLRQTPFRADDTMRLQGAVLLDLPIHHVDAFHRGVQRIRVLSEGRLDHGVPWMTAALCSVVEGHVDEFRRVSGGFHEVGEKRKAYFFRIKKLQSLKHACTPVERFLALSKQATHLNVCSDVQIFIVLLVGLKFEKRN